MSSSFSGSAVPTAIAADAFYEKATKVTALLQLVAATPQFDGLYSIYRAGLPAPVWIDVPSGESHVVMTCSECLRTFTHVEGETGSLIHEADCAYCNSSIQYVIVQPASPAPSHRNFSKPNLGVSPQLSAPCPNDGATGDNKCGSNSN